MSRNNKTDFYIYYDLEYKGHKESYSYDIPFDIFVEGIRKFFDDRMAPIDGTDNAVWNVIADLGEDAFDHIFDEMEDWFKERCKEPAEEEFREWAEEYLEDEE